MPGYTKEYAPKFISAPTAFHVILRNMNYGLHGKTPQVATQDNTQVTTQDNADNTQDNTQVTTQDNRIAALLNFCESPRTRDEMQMHIGIVSREHFRKNILKPLLESGQLRMTLPDVPNSRNQRYVKPTE